MKTKLLRKVRRKYKIVVNDLGSEKIMVKTLFGWTDHMSIYESFAIITHLKNTKNYYIENRLIGLLIYKYGKYHRKTKQYHIKSNNWKKTFKTK